MKSLNLHPKKMLKDLQQRLYSSQYTYLAFCFIVPIVAMFIIYCVLWISLGGDGTPLVLDLNSQYVYFFEKLRSLVYGEGSILYSFGRSLGGEFMGMYAYYLASPLSYIVALFPQDRIQEAILCILLLKTGLCGLSFGFYLHKRTRRPDRLAVFAFSMMYALCAFAVVHQSNTMWIDALIWLPIFVYSLEELVSKRKFKLYVISLSVILISNYYIGYMVCIFAVLYFCYYYFSKSPLERNPRAERLHFVRAGSRFAVFSLLSAGISAFMLIAAYYSLGFGKSDFSNPNWSLTAKFEILDFFSKILPGAYDTVEPAGLPFIYCGILAVILLPVYFTAKKISSRERVASAALLAVFLASFFINPLDLIWHGFSVPNWLNGRYSFLFCFTVLVLAYKGLGNLKRAGEKFLLGICGFLLLFIAIVEKYDFKSYINTDNTFTLDKIRVDGSTLFKLGCIWISVIFTLAFLVVLCLKIRARSEKTIKSISSLLAAVVCAELIINGAVCFLWFNSDVVFSRYSRYQNHIEGLRPVTEQLQEYDGGFYRAEKTDHRNKNDNMALGLKGVTSSTSTLNADAIKFANRMGYTGRAHITMYNGGTPLSDSLLGIRYVIDKKTSTRFSHLYRYVGEIESDKYNVYRNPYAMSLAYGVSSDIKDFTFSEDLNNTSTFFNEYNSLVSAMLGEDKKLELFKSVNLLEISGDYVYSGDNIRSTAPDDDTAIVAFTYSAPYTGNYYFYSPVVYPTELKIAFNRETSQKYLGGDTNHILDAGYYHVGEEIKVLITLPEGSSIDFKRYLSFLWYLDEEVYDDCMQKLMSNPQFAIDDGSEEHHLTGSMTTASADQMILTTIPYDEGWKVYVDGEQVEIYETLDALMAFDIDAAGEHTLEMKYMPDCYVLGIIISISSILLFAALCVLEVVLRRTILKNRTPSYSDEFWVLEDNDEPALIADKSGSSASSDDSNDNL